MKVGVLAPVLTLRPDVAFVEEPGGSASFRREGSGGLTMRGLTPAHALAMRSLAHGRFTLDELAEPMLDEDDLIGIGRLYYYVDCLRRALLLRYVLTVDGGSLLAVEPTAPQFNFAPEVLDADALLQLSHLAFSYRRGTELVIETPLAGARAILASAKSAALVTALTRPQELRRLSSAESISEIAVASAVAYMVATGVVESPGASADLDHITRQWEPHDLLFHFMSRRGQHDGPVGATYRFIDEIGPEPALKKPMSGTAVKLRRPAIADLEVADPPFTRVLELRRSIRLHDDCLMSVGQLGEFLYRIARVRGDVTPCDPAHGVFYETTSRPYPSGGAMYELELYVTVGACDGLARGIYHYEPGTHSLRRLVSEDAYVDDLLQDAGLSAGGTPAPQMLITITSRLRRLSWKYAGMAYATTLKNVGVLYQTMYLVATAMGLAPCALGNGDTTLIARALGLSQLDEAPVGEFMLGIPRSLSHV